MAIEISTANAPWIKMATHYHQRPPMEALARMSYRDYMEYMRKESVLLRQRITDNGLNCVTLDDYIGPGKVHGRNRTAFYFNSLIDHPELMGKDCMIVGKYNRYLAVYIKNGESYSHAFDLIWFAEIAAKEAHIIILAPEIEVNHRKGADGSPTNSLYHEKQFMGVFSRNVPNSPRELKEVIDEFRGRCLLMYFPHINYKMGYDLKDIGPEAIEEAGRIIKQQNLEGLLRGMQSQDMLSECFNASVHRVIGKGYDPEILRQIKEGRLQPGLVGDATYFKWIGNNSFKVQVDYDVPPFESKSSAEGQLDSRMSRLAEALKSRKIKIDEFRPIPVDAFLKKAISHLWWHLKFPIGLAR